MRKHLWAIIILSALSIVLLTIQFRHPLALNFDGGYNAANTEALMRLERFPFSGSPVLPFAFSALFGLLAGSASAGIKIASTLSLVAVGLMIYLFVRDRLNDSIASIFALLGWCVCLGAYTYIAGYLKQTVALPFVVGGLMALWYAITKKNYRWWIAWGICSTCVYLCHTPSAMVFFVASVFTATVLFWTDGGRRERIIAWAMLGCIGLGLLSIPWSVPFLSKYVPQLSLGGWKTIWIYIKGLFSHRYQMTTDFSLFSIPLLVAPIAGLVLLWLKNRRLALWMFAFGCAIMLISLFAVKYEWQGRNVMTFLVPIAILSGTACWHGAAWLSRYRRPRLVIGILLAVAVIFMAGWPQTLIKYAKDAKPIVSTEQVKEMERFLTDGGAGNRFLPNLYARHGLRFWATYASKSYLGVFFYDWDRKAIGIRQSRSGEDLGPSHTPGKGEYILVSKRPIPPAPATLCAGDKFAARIQSKAQEYLGIEIDSVDKLDGVWIALRDSRWNLVRKADTVAVTYGRNTVGMLLVGVKKGDYWVQVGWKDHVVPPAQVQIEENYLEWAKSGFAMRAQSDNFLIIEATEVMK